MKEELGDPFLEEMEEKSFILFQRNKNFFPFLEEGEINYSVFEEHETCSFLSENNIKSCFILLIEDTSFHFSLKKNLVHFLERA